jgi:hypothetical protein
MIDAAVPCATGARQIKLGKDARRSPCWSDGVASTAANTLFLVAGIFVP